MKAIEPSPQQPSAGLAIGEPVGDLSAESTAGRFSLSDHRGAPVVIYFYPKDDTPGCTTEGAAFRDLHDAFRKTGATIVGVSRDSMRSHHSFKAKMAFPFELVSDADEALCRRFDVIRNKKMYGKDVRGIDRSTFVIDRNGRLAKAWRGVTVPGHADEVLAFVKTL
ncbi:MAG TPA: peroxiredoxin [Casimicrobiaceae bacterium]|nr:peroxiredoxin [Casimicrobiaceae bacterium]